MKWVIVAAALVLACAPRRGAWLVEGAAWDSGPWVAAAVAVTGDRAELLAAGGRIVALPDLTAACGFPAYGCAGPGLVYVEAGPRALRALAHELCHLGLTRGGGYSGPVVLAAEPEADACALLVHQAVTP